MHSRRTFLRTAAGGAAAATGALAALAEARSWFTSELASTRPASAAMGSGAPSLPTPDDYLLDPEIQYLNHGSIGTIPRAVHAAHRRYLEICESNPWLYMWDEPWIEPLEDVRRRAADLLGCGVHEMALTHNTTEGFNLLAHGLELEPGDEVLYSSLNHPGASNPWTHMAPIRGFRVRRFDFPVQDLPGLSSEEVVELHLREITDRTRVLVFPHVDNLVGLRHPMEALARGAKARGVEVVAVDGAQSVAMIPVELASSGVDVYAASPHKWVQSPKGLGLLYLREGFQDRVHPMWVSSGQPGAAGTIRRFEDYGTRNRPEVMALGDALTFQETIGDEARTAHHRNVWAGVRDRVEATEGLLWRSPRRWELSTALYNVEVEGVPSPELSSRLWEEERIVFRPIRIGGIDGARLSPNLQTAPESLEAFFRAVDQRW
jgi:isopenicillin-N epimerase